MTDRDAMIVRDRAELALPVVTAEQMVKALEAYRGLQKSLDQSMPDQIMTLEGKPFRKKGYWRAISLAFSLNVEMIEERREVSGRFIDGRDNFGWVVTYRATHPSGRTDVGDGACFAVEKARRFKCPHPEHEGSKRVKHFPSNTCPDWYADFQWKALPAEATEHNVRSHAHTRAFNRAVSNLVGFGEVSAEEAEGREEPAETSTPAPKPAGTSSTPAASAQPATVPAAADGTTTIASVRNSKGVSKQGPWKGLHVTFADGRKAATFDEVTQLQVEEYRKGGLPCLPDIIPGDKGPKLNGFLPIPKPEPVHVDEPVTGPERILTIRTVITANGDRYIIQTDKREVVSDLELLALEAGEARAGQKGLIPQFEVIKAGGKSVNRLTAWVSEAREVGQEG